MTVSAESYVRGYCRESYVLYNAAKHSTVLDVLLMPS